MLATNSRHSSFAPSSSSPPSSPSSLWPRLSRRASRSQAPSKNPEAAQRHQQHISSDIRQTEKASMISHHMQKIDISMAIRPSRNTPSPTPRVHASDMRISPFPDSFVSTTAWNIFLRPDQIRGLVVGFKPEAMEDKWFIYSEGPDRTGKLKVHFHRSWTGIHIATLFVVVDLRGEGAGKIVGVKWNASEQTNWMSEEEAKYMVSTTCEWVLGIGLDGDVS